MAATNRSVRGRPRWRMALAGAAIAAVVGSGALILVAQRMGSGMVLVAATPSAERTAHSTYQCPMHPQIVQDHPGNCPICHMRLEKVEARGGEAPAVPGRAAFQLSDRRQQLIGVRTVKAGRQPLRKTLRLPGRVSGDGGTILAQLLEIDSGKLAAGMEAALMGPDGQRVTARVDEVDESLDTLTRSFSVSLRAGEPAAWLKSGIFVEVRIALHFGDRMAVPTDAVLDTGDQQIVFVAGPNGTYEPRQVRLGREGDDLVEVVTGVHEGERVVCAANFLIDSESRFRAAIQQFR